MVDKINVEIGLDGGEEVVKQLDNIGKAGQQAFSEIQGAADQVNLQSTTAQFDDLGTAGQAAFQKVKTAAESAVAFEQVVQGVKKVEGAFEALGSAAAKVGARLTRSLGALGVLARALGPLGIAIGVAGGAFVKFGDDSADALNKLTGAAAKLGQTPQTLDRLQKSLASLGISTDAISDGLQKFRESLGADFTGDFTAALQQFIAQLERMPDTVQRTQLAMATLGDALGSQVIAGLQAGTVGVAQFTQALSQVQPVTQAQIAQAAQYQAAINQLSAAWTSFKEVFMPIVAAAATPVFQFITNEIKALSQDIKALIIDVQMLWQFLQALGSVFTAQGPEQMRAALQRVAEAYKQLGTGAEQVRQQLAQGMSAAAQTTTAAGAAAEQATLKYYQMAEAGTQAGNQVSEGMNASTQAVGNFIIATQNGIQVLQGVTQEAARLAQFVGNLDRPTSVPFIRPDRIGPGMAGGGLLAGRGTGTSDSNLAWVSRGEYITPARAVAQPGVLAFLEALRRSGGNLRGVLDSMGRFALGGLVPRPRFAAGGAVGSMSPVTINFPGTPPITGLHASSSVITELQRAAALAQVRSGGRKPSRYS